MKITCQMICIFLACLVFMIFTACSQEVENFSIYPLEGEGYTFELPGVKGKVTHIEFCERNAEDSTDKYLNIYVEWYDFDNYDRDKLHEATDYRIAFTQGDETIYKLIIPISVEENDCTDIVRISDCAFEPDEMISVDLYYVDSPNKTDKCFKKHFFMLPKFE